MPAGDRFREAGWDAAYERFEMLKSALDDRVTSWAQFAIKFALSHPIVTSLIVGMNTPHQVDAVLDAADGNYMDRQVFERAWDIFTAHGLVPS